MELLIGCAVTDAALAGSEPYLDCTARNLPAGRCIRRM